MIFNPFSFLFPKKFVGVDVGTSAIKLVEISRWGKGTTLENYGEIKSGALFEESFQTFETATHLISEEFVGRAIKAILKEAKIRTKSAIFSLPDFSTFVTTFELPPMTEKEIPEAVHYTAPRYTPLPIKETTLDWHLIGGTPGDKKSHLKILLIAIPKEVVEKYQETAKRAGLQLYALEAEVLAINRALVKNEKKVICLVEIGAQSSTISIVDKGIFKKSYSSDFSSNRLTHSISASLDMEYSEAEKTKTKHGLISSQEIDLRDSLVLLINPFLEEIKKISDEFSRKNEKPVEEIYLSGGGANLPGLKKYIQKETGKKTKIPNCFSGILSPPILDKTLKEISPRFAGAVGAAIGELW